MICKGNARCFWCTIIMTMQFFYLVISKPFYCQFYCYFQIFYFILLGAPVFIGLAWDAFKFLRSALSASCWLWIFHFYDQSICSSGPYLASLELGLLPYCALKTIKRLVIDHFKSVIKLTDNQSIIVHKPCCILNFKIEAVLEWYFCCFVHLPIVKI